MDFSGIKKMGKATLSVLILLITLLFAFPAYSQISKIHVEDKAPYSRVILYLDKAHTYKLDKSKEEKVIIRIDSAFSEPLPEKSYKSNLIDNIISYETENGETGIEISLLKKLSLVSSFFLKSPPRIMINIEGKGEIQKNSEEKDKAVNIRQESLQKKSSIKKEQPAKKAPPVKKGEPSPFDSLEGFEDLINPSIDRFVEIFDTENPLSIYHISLPPTEELKDYPSLPPKHGDYELKDPYLTEAAKSLGKGNYKQALFILGKTPKSAKKSEAYAFLKADSLFEKALIEGGISDVINKYMDLLADFPKSKHAPWAYLQIGKGKLALKSYNGAVNAFKKVLADYRGSSFVSQAKLGLAKSYSDKHIGEEALRMYKDFITNHPESPFLAEAVFGAAREMTNLGRYRKASLLFRKGVERWPQYAVRDAQILMMIGESFYNSKLYDDAANYYSKLINLYPDNNHSNRAMGRIGDIYFQLGNIKGAQKVYAEIESKYPGSDGALVGMIRRGHILEMEGAKVDRVMKHYKNVYEKFTENFLAQVATLRAGLFLASRNRYLEAFELYDSFMTLYPKSKLFNAVTDEILKIFPRLLEESYKKGDCLELIRLAGNRSKLVLALKEKDSALFSIGDCHFRFGQFDEAIKNLEEIKSGEYFEKALFMSAKAANLSGNFKKAIKLLESYKKRFPQNDKEKEISYLLAKGYSNEGNFKKASPHLKSYIKMEKDNKAKAEALIQLGMLNKKSGNAKKAIEAYEEGIKLYSPNEDHSTAYFFLGEAYFEQKSYKKSLDAFSSVRKDSGENLYEAARYKVALCLDKLGEKKKAQEILQELSAGKDKSFWDNLSAAKIDDLKWQATHD